MNPFVFHINDFCEGSLQLFTMYISLCREYNQKVLPIVIDSDGGYVYSLNGIMALIESTKDIKFATICYAKAFSCGAFLLAMGEPGMRHASKRATIVVHEPGGGAMGKVSDMEAAVNEAKRLRQNCFDIFNQRCGQMPGFFEAKLKEINNADLFLDPDQCFSYGIVDSLELPNINDLVFPPDIEPENVIPSLYNSSKEYSNISLMMRYKEDNKNYLAEKNIIIPVPKGDNQPMTEEEKKEMDKLKADLKAEKEAKEKAVSDSISTQAKALKLITDLSVTKNQNFVSNLIAEKKLLPARENAVLALLNDENLLSNDALKAKLEAFLNGESAGVDTKPIPLMPDKPGDTAKLTPIDFKNEKAVEAAVLAYAEKNKIDIKNPAGVMTAYNGFVASQGIVSTYN